jgi:hypothetical protein
MATNMKPAKLIVTTASDPVTETDMLMQKCAADDNASYGSKQRLAAHLNRVMPPMWHSTPKGKTPLAEAAEAKRIQCRDIYTAEGTKYFDQAWGVIKKTAAEIDGGIRNEDGDLIGGAEGEGAEGESKGKQERKDCDQVWLDALAGLIVRTEKDQKAGRPVQAGVHYVRLARRMIAMSKSMTKLDKLANAAEAV